MRKYFPDEGQRAEAGRLECVEGGQERHAADANWNSLLRQSRSLEGQALRPEERHLVHGLRPL